MTDFIRRPEHSTFVTPVYITRIRVLDPLAAQCLENEKRRHKNGNSYGPCKRKRELKKARMGKD
jgi:hypothetical protein